MKVLWFCNTPSRASEYLSFSAKGGGWMSSLEGHLVEDGSIQLAIAFFYNDYNGFKFSYEKTTYYPIPTGNPNVVQKLIRRHQHQLPDQAPASYMLKIIDDFDPDVINIFGTESDFGKIIPHTKKPVISHLQGIINGYLGNWFPVGVSNNSIFFKTPVSELVRGIGLYHEYFIFKKRATREAQTFANCSYFLGRTHWDRYFVTALAAKNARYFHCDEMIRDIFWSNKWQHPQSKKIIISTTINPDIYKGLDILLKTAQLLKEQLKADFEWHIYGIHENFTVVSLFEKLLKMQFSAYSVYFHGPLNADQLVEKLKTTTVFVHPSHIDNSPNSICEAMLMGIPVIATNVGGIASLITDKHDGFLYSHNDHYALAVMISEIGANAEELNRVANNAYITARERHDPARIMGQLKQAYQQLISGVEK